MRYIAILIFVIGLIAPAYSSKATQDEKDFIRYETITPCDRWRYDASTNTYTCQFYPSRIDVVEAREVQRVIDALERKIESLEARVAELEQADETE